MASVTKNSDENRAERLDGDDADLVSSGASSADADARAPNRSTAVATGKSTARSGGYFSIYKKGQGYWTRMGTLIGVSILGLMLTYTIYEKVPTFFSNTTTEAAALQATVTERERRMYDAESPNVEPSKRLTTAQREELAASVNDDKARIAAMNQAKQARVSRISIVAAAMFLLIFSATAIVLMNKPDNVDFLIATDSEMKKVNWTSRRELIGSTKVVVAFMFLIAALLFVIDWIFHLLFYLITVMKVPPPGIPR